jgi:hypothetical protein
MPDLLTHSLAAYLATRCWFWHRWRPRSWAIIFVAGTMLPDLLSRPFYILFPLSYWWAMPLHTPVGITLVGWLITGLFPANERRVVFTSLFAGAMLHFLLDAPQKHIAAGYFWLFPFSWTTYEWGLWWPEESLRVLPAAVFIVVFAEILLYLRTRTEGRTRKEERQK